MGTSILTGGITITRGDGSRVDENGGGGVMNSVGQFRHAGGGNAPISETLKQKLAREGKEKVEIRWDDRELAAKFFAGEKLDDAALARVARDPDYFKLAKTWTDLSHASPAAERVVKLVLDQPKNLVDLSARVSLLRTLTNSSTDAETVAVLNSTAGLPDAAITGSGVRFLAEGRTDASMQLETRRALLSLRAAKGAPLAAQDLYPFVARDLFTASTQAVPWSATEKGALASARAFVITATRADTLLEPSATYSSAYGGSPEKSAEEFLNRGPAFAQWLGVDHDFRTAEHSPSARSVFGSARPPASGRALEGTLKLTKAEAERPVLTLPSGEVIKLHAADPGAVRRTQKGVTFKEPNRFVGFDSKGQFYALQYGGRQVAPGLTHASATLEKYAHAVPWTKKSGSGAGDGTWNQTQMAKPVETIKLG